MEENKNLKKNELTDTEAEKVSGGKDENYQTEHSMGDHKCRWCNQFIYGTAFLYQGKYYHRDHLPFNLM